MPSGKLPTVQRSLRRPKQTLQYSPFRDLIDKTRAKQTSPRQWSGHCPAHDDTRRSLSISVGKKNQVLVNCHAGCDPTRRTYLRAIRVFSHWCQGRGLELVRVTGVLAAAGIAISMDGRGRALDNVFIERLWRSVKYENI